MKPRNTLFYLTLVITTFSLCFLPTSDAKLDIGNILDIVKFTKDIVIGIAKAWQIVDGHISYSEVPLPLLQRAEEKILGRLNVVNGKLSQLSEQVERIGTENIYALAQRILKGLPLELRLNDLSQLIYNVKFKYSRMQAFSTNDTLQKFERKTLEDFADAVVTNEGESIVNTLDKIQSYIAPIDDDNDGFIQTGILGLLVESFKTRPDIICEYRQSPQQVLYNLYNSLVVSELKGYAMIQFSYMLLRLYDKGNFTRESQLMEHTFKERTDRAIYAVKLAMQEASREFLRCDPARHEKGKTYVDITALLQGYVQNEVDLNPLGTCKENCAEYQYTKSHGCYQNLFCNTQRKCNGKIRNCKYIDSDMNICTADPKSGRRYEYIEYENGMIYGRKDTCTRGKTTVESWWRWLFWHCSYCTCICDEEGPFSDRYISLRPSLSDIKNNKVVTGIRFVKKNRLIHLQIEQGTLLPFGSIDKTSVEWSQIDDFKINDFKVFAGQDYHTLTYEKRGIDLDDVIADKNHVVVGVRFKLLGSNINLDVLISPFNVTTGLLDDPEGKSMWIDNPNTDVSKTPRTRVQLINPDITTRAPFPSNVLSKTDQFIEFTHTSFEKDAAQTTVPFLDSQDVRTSKPVALSGIGIYYKGAKGFGGFIAPKIITYDLSHNLKPVFSRQDDIVTPAPNKEEEASTSRVDNLNEPQVV